MNLTKIEKGYSVGKLKYMFDYTKEVEILSDNQCHIPTDNGIMFFDTTVSIDNQFFETLEDWIDKLYS